MSGCASVQTHSHKEIGRESEAHDDLERPGGGISNDREGRRPFDLKG